ncbi:mechanosensitive ion channel family protein [Sphingopyxis yananensis]|uniref:mechanosensitive ion channel family protein n=1 Tax=Sphingopyxis yananensis TaxID=2886687 RepID=UPI001D11010B|nr:mechanosensitive ion channel domain-containing protein [Sphingopyxis yananensis]MCC2601720.1 mechanosensitive ion channel family protein [Sphingopyxis yananensis]
MTNASTAASTIVPIMPKARIDAATQFHFWWDSSWQWADDNWLKIAIALGAGLLIYGLLSLILNFALKRAEKVQGEYAITDIVSRVIRKTKTFILAMLSIRLVAGYAEPPTVVMNIIHFIFTVAVVLQVAIWAREIILGLIHRRAVDGQNETLSNAMGIIRMLISVALFGIAAIVILDNMGVNVTGLIAGMGIGGIAIGLAAQGIFSDLFASLSIIFDRPFRVGETIKYDQSTATVEKIGMKSTRLRSINGELLVVSNTNLLAKEITNFANLARRRVSFMIGLIYQTSPEQLRAFPALLEKQVRDAGHEFIRASFVTFSPSSLDFDLLFDVYSEDFDVVTAARTDIAVRVYEAMTQQGYQFAYPTQTTFTAAPDGTMVMPYADSARVHPTSASKPI